MYSSKLRNIQLGLSVPTFVISSVILNNIFDSNLLETLLHAYTISYLTRSDHCKLVCAAFNASLSHNIFGRVMVLGILCGIELTAVTQS